MPSPEAAGAPGAHAATCAGCGIVCDDITAVVGADERLERLERTCPLGDAWFAARAVPTAPAARVDGREVPLEAALDEAAAILGAARMPLVYGLGQTTCEGQRAAVALADAIGATIDPAGPALDGASGLAFSARGASTATLGDVRDRAEVVVVWRADPVTTHPRLLERVRLPGDGRTLVVLDERRTATAEQADVFVEVPAGRDVETLFMLRALVREERLAGDRDPALVEALEGVAARLRDCGNGAVLHHVHGRVAALALHALVRDLDRITHIVSVTLRHEGNAAGAEDVLAWQTGYPAAVSLASGHPRSSPGEFSAAAVLARGDADAALVVGSDPLAHLPAAAAERLRAIPVVSVDARNTATAAAARVAFTTAAGGVHRPGVVHRLDGVPVPLRAVLATDRPGDDEVLAAIAERIARAGEGAA
jgi:formylmethanofuran dehydrogenase subunit B